MSKILDSLGCVAWLVSCLVIGWAVGFGVMYVIEFYGLPPWIFFTFFVIISIVWLKLIFSNSRKTAVYDSSVPKVRTAPDDKAELIKPITTGKYVEYRESFHIKYSPAINFEMENNDKFSLSSYAASHNLWICSYCESFNSKGEKKCIVCGLGEQR